MAPSDNSPADMTAEEQLENGLGVDVGGNPKECPECGGGARKERFSVHTEPPEVSIKMKCRDCGCRATYAYRAEPTLEVSR